MHSLIWSIPSSTCPVVHPHSLTPRLLIPSNSVHTCVSFQTSWERMMTQIRVAASSPARSISRFARRHLSRALSASSIPGLLVSKGKMLEARSMLNSNGPTAEIERTETLPVKRAKWPRVLIQPPIKKLEFEVERILCKVVVPQQPIRMLRKSRHKLTDRDRDGFEPSTTVPSQQSTSIADTNYWGHGSSGVAPTGSPRQSTSVHGADSKYSRTLTQGGGSS